MKKIIAIAIAIATPVAFFLFAPYMADNLLLSFLVLVASYFGLMAPHYVAPRKTIKDYMPICREVNWDI